MSYYPDLGHKSMVAAGEQIRAVGWLHPDHPFQRGAPSAEFVAKLDEFVRFGVHCAEEIGWGIFMGLHTCEFCENTHGVHNIGVPAGDVLFVAPEMVIHYVEQHGYLPPAEFVAAVLASPLPGTPQYRAAAEPFRQSQTNQLRSLGFTEL